MTPDTESQDIRHVFERQKIELESRILKLMGELRLITMERDELKRKVESYVRTMGELPESAL